MADYLYYTGYDGNIPTDASGQYNAGFGTINIEGYYNSIHFIRRFRGITNSPVYIFMCHNPGDMSIVYNNSTAYYAFSNTPFIIYMPMKKEVYDPGYATGIVSNSTLTFSNGETYYTTFGGGYKTFNSDYTGTYTETFTDEFANLTIFPNMDSMLIAVKAAGIRPIAATYPITYHYTNSTVSGPAEAAVGDIVTVSAVPDAGYGITDASTQILVTNNDVAVPYTWDAVNQRITFTMPDPS